ncbi:MAG: homoprotocatechuate degradation operon regulator HpaR [Paracoccaceae bacterium]
MTSGLPETTRSLPIALIRARERVMAPIREMLRESGITEQQWRILRVLSESGPQDASRLAERACILLPSMTRISRSLIKKGLIERETDSKDRRRYTVSITQNGQKIIDDNLPKATEIAAQYRARIGDDRFEALLDLLQDISDL